MKPETFKRLLSITILMLSISYGGMANIFTVTNTNNSGSGSLRQAITDANATPAKDTIRFLIADISGNNFEGTFPARYAVITVTSALPSITRPLFIDGSTQINTNTAIMPGKLVGVDNILQPSIPFPDVYLVPNYSMPTTNDNILGNGLSINSADVKIQGLAISGFGNRSTNQATAVGHGDISILKGTASRTLRTEIMNCFLSCDPLGNLPSTAMRRSKSGGLLILGNNNEGIVKENYVAHSGGYGIVFHGGINNNLASTTTSLRSSRYWHIKDNQIINIGTSTTYSSAYGRAADGISMLNTLFVKVEDNYISDFEQVGIDLGHNTDNNMVYNNTVTGFVKNIGSAPVSGIRIGFSSQSDTIQKNRVFNNTGNLLVGGIYMDENYTSTSSFAGAVVKDNRDHLIIENEVFDNNGSGIVLSNNGSGNLYNVTITRNSTYNNTGLGIDLNYGTSTMVSLNDNGDSDNGTNRIQNFPIIDSSKYDGSYVYIWGKGPAGSVMEFFVGDGGINNHGGTGLNYGEGKTFIGSAVEDGIEDGVIGVTGSYNIDGNIASNNVNLFQFVFPFSGNINTQDLTSTATLNGNTSEFGPVNFILGVLGCNLLHFSAVSDKTTILHWKSLVDGSFSHFEIEKSVDGQHFFNISKIYNIKAAPETGIYTYNDVQLTNGTVYYRLKLVNSDRSSSYSSVLTINTNIGSTIKVFPNPFNRQLGIQTEVLTDQVVEVKLLDLSGRLLQVQNIQARKGVNALNLDINNNIPKGNYILQINADNEIKTQIVNKK